MDRDKAVEYGKRCIGFHVRLTKKKHNKHDHIPNFYPHRNYIGSSKPIDELEEMCEEGLMQKDFVGETLLHVYSLTPDGLEWLSKELYINIDGRRQTWTL